MYCRKCKKEILENSVYCKNYGDKTIYVPNYSVATLFKAGMCDRCFPDMY